MAATTTPKWIRGPDIGCGATATVSLAVCSSSGHLFAVKSAELSRSRPLQREQSILLSLDSPSVVSCLGSDISPGRGGILLYNLFLEYAAGGSLAGEIGRHDENSARSRAREILCGLAYLHAAGVVHCDVKPGNVLIASDGRAVIGDLGCARRASDREAEIRGSPMYMSPEAARGEEQGAPADVWAFGCTLIEMITGRPPWPDAAYPVQTIRMIAFSGNVPEVPPQLSDEAKDLVANCFRMDPRERWTAEQLLSHPFFAASTGSVGDCNWVSPKSTLDLSLWRSVEEEEDQEEEEEEGGRFLERIGELAAASSDGPNWNWQEGWMEVRSFVADDDVAFEVSSICPISEILCLGSEPKNVTLFSRFCNNKNIYFSNILAPYKHKLLFYKVSQYH